MTRHLINCNNCGGNTYEKLARVRGNRGVKFIGRYHTVVICKNCGLIYLNPQHEEIDYQKFYSGLNVVNKIVPETILKNINNQNSGRAQVRDFLLKNIEREDLGEKPKLLDIGCGIGRFLYLLKDAGFVLEGLEPGKVERDFVRNVLNLNINDGILANHKLDAESYDIVTALAVIEHVNNPLKTIEAMANLIKPNGYILLTTPSYRHMNLRRGVENYFKFVHTFYFTEITLASLMKQAGFDIIKTWIREPEYKKSALLGDISIGGGALLCIIGRKRTADTGAAPDKDSPNDLINVLNKAKKYYFWQYTTDRSMRYINAGFRLIKRKLLNHFN